MDGGDFSSSPSRNAWCFSPKFPCITLVLPSVDLCLEFGLLRCVTKFRKSNDEWMFTPRYTKENDVL